MGPDCARATPANPLKTSTTRLDHKASAVRRKSVLRRLGFMPVIVPEFHPACKIEARDHHAFRVWRIRRRADAKTARDDAVDRLMIAERLDAALGHAVRRAL